MLIQIAHNAVNAKLLTENKELKYTLSELLSYQVSGYENMSNFQNGNWDGRSSFFNFKKATFPAGFVLMVKSKFEQMGHQVQIIRPKVPEPIGDPEMKVDSFGRTPEYEYQYNAVERLLKMRQMIARVATGGGKCLGIDTPVLMYDGTIKKVQDVVVGDKLMGPDSQPRNVLSVTKGQSKLYKIIPTKGDSYVVNDAHILSLKSTTHHNKPKGEIININVEDFINSGSYFKHTHKGWRTGVDFKDNYDGEIDPYFIGLLIGDGTIKHTVSLCTADQEIVDYVTQQAKKHNLKITKCFKKNNKASMYYFSNGLIGGKENYLMKQLRKLDLEKTGENKYIPHVLKTSSKENRLRLLAGLIDSDGYYGNNIYSLTFKSEKLIDDCIFVARSLGFSAYKSKHLKKCYNTGAVGEYYSAHISGNIDIIPTILPRKKAHVRLQKKDVLVTGIKVEENGFGDYYGFEIDGDHLFLLGDFTVTHNTRVAKLAISRIGRKTLFLTTRKTLMYQMKKNVESTMNVEVGVIGDSVMNVKPFVNVGMVQTIAANLKSRTIQEEVVRLKELEHNKFEKLIAEKDKILTKQLKLGHITLQTKFKILSDFKKELNSKTKDLAVLQRAATINCKIMNRKKAEMEKLLSTFEFVIAEEAHESGGNEYFEVMQYCTNAHYRLALTATPFMKDDEEANMRLMACSGIIGIVVTEKELIDKGILAKPYFMFINNARPTGVFPTTNYVSAYEKGIVKNNIRNDEIVKWSKWSADRNLPVLILVNRTEHGNILKDLIQKQGLKCNFIYGKDEDEVRQENLKKLESGEINVLIGTNILDVGVDVPSIGMVILAAGGKAEVQLRQRIGRGLRRKKTGKNITYIIDFQDSFNQHLLKHAKTRQEIIKNTPGFAEGIVPTFCFN